MLGFSLRTKQATRLSLALFSAAVCFLSPLDAWATFKCVDDRGVTHYGDVMPWQCAKTPVNEVSRSGSVVRRYEAPLTPEQIAARNAQALKDKEAKRLADEQKIKDAALLASYSSERDFDISRDRELLQLETRLTNQKNRIADLTASVQKRKDDLEFYKSGRVKKVTRIDPKNPPKPIEAPPELVAALARAEQERAAIDVQIASSEAERKIVTDRYETEKARWAKLKYGANATINKPTVGTTASAPSAAKK